LTDLYATNFDIKLTHVTVNVIQGHFILTRQYNDMIVQRDLLSLHELFCHCWHFTYSVHGDKLLRIVSNHIPFFLHGATVPSEPRPTYYQASLSHSDTPHSVGFLWTSDRPVAETST